MCGASLLVQELRGKEELAAELRNANVRSASELIPSTVSSLSSPMLRDIGTLAGGGKGCCSRSSSPVVCLAQAGSPSQRLRCAWLLGLLLGRLHSKCWCRSAAATQARLVGPIVGRRALIPVSVCTRERRACDPFAFAHRPRHHGKCPTTDAGPLHRACARCSLRCGQYVLPVGALGSDIHPLSHPPSSLRSRCSRSPFERSWHEE